MKNILVIVVTIGIGYAYWYQLPDAPVTPAATPTPAVAAPVRKPAFTAAHTALDEPANSLGSKPKQSSLLLGNDTAKPTH